jgi:hypothetical protein
MAAEWATDQFTTEAYDVVVARRCNDVGHYGSPFWAPGAALGLSGEIVIVPVPVGVGVLVVGVGVGVVVVGVGVGVGVGVVVVGVGVGVLLGFGFNALPTSARGGKLSTFFPSMAAVMNAVQMRAGYAPPKNVGNPPTPSRSALPVPL